MKPDKVTQDSKVEAVMLLFIAARDQYVSANFPFF